jgi:hypothetical protein
MREVYHVKVLAQRLLNPKHNAIPETAVGAIENVRTLEIDNGWSSAFSNGFTDGQAARDRNQPLTAYVRVGIDDYAKGYRQGFFKRTTAGVRSVRQTSLQIARL